MKVRYGPMGVHMFDRRSGLNILFDEAVVPTERWSAAPRYVSIALTNACDLRCPYCYADKHAARLPSDQVKDWVRQLDSAGCFGVGFGGGEPTLYPGFVDLCRELHETTDVAITVTTHGHRFTTLLSDQLVGNVEFIRLSMDGIGETYQRLRGRPFPTFVEKLDIVRRTARFGINYVVNEDTIDDLAEAADFAIENGAEELLLLPEMGPGNQFRIPPRIQERLSKWVSQNYTRCRLATSARGATFLDAPVLPTSDPDRESYEFMHIDASAVLKPSAFARSGIRLQKSKPILDAVAELRLEASRHDISQLFQLEVLT